MTNMHQNKTLLKSFTNWSCASETSTTLDDINMEGKQQTPISVELITLEMWEQAFVFG